MGGGLTYIISLVCSGLCCLVFVVAVVATIVFYIKRKPADETIDTAHPIPTSSTASVDDEDEDDMATVVMSAPKPPKAELPLPNETRWEERPKTAPPPVSGTIIAFDDDE